MGGGLMTLRSRLLKRALWILRWHGLSRKTIYYGRIESN